MSSGDLAVSLVALICLFCLCLVFTLVCGECGYICV